MVCDALGDQLLPQFPVRHLIDGPAHVEEPDSMRFCISDQGFLNLAHFEVHKLVALR